VFAKHSFHFAFGAASSRHDCEILDVAGQGFVCSRDESGSDEELEKRHWAYCVRIDSLLHAEGGSE
jgi:hypothetical protein